MNVTRPNDWIEIPGPLRVAIAEFLQVAESYRIARAERLALERRG